MSFPALTVASYSDSWLCEALGLVLAPRPDLHHTSLATEPNQVTRGSLYCPVHYACEGTTDTLLHEARRAGATGVILPRDQVPSGDHDLRIYPVDNLLQALQRLAVAHRQRLAGTVIAVTGQNGKSTTKELLAAALRTTFRTHATPANHNGTVGTAATLLRAPLDADMVVLEVGASRPGPLAVAAEILAPDLTVITNSGPGHLTGFPSPTDFLEDLLHLARPAICCFAGNQPPELPRRLHAALPIPPRIVGDTDTPAPLITLLPDGRPRFHLEGHAVELPLRGYHHGQNAVLAWHVARAAGVPAEHIARAFAAAHPLPGRSQWFRGVALHVCDDAYNANPDSLAAGMAMARHIARDHRLVVVLDTLEDLGRDSLAWHIEALLAVLEAQPAAVYVHGQFVEAADRLIWPATTALHTAAPHPDGPVAAFWPVLSTTLAAGDVVYLKASHASRLDRLTPRLLAWTPPSASSP